MEKKIIEIMEKFFGEDLRRIKHAHGVWFEAKRIMSGKLGCDEDIMVACALLHDIGIKPSEEELGYNNAKTQEQYGPVVAGELLNQIDFPIEKLKIVKDIISNHHSPSRFDYLELEILKEADRIVNMAENSLNK